MLNIVIKSQDKRTKEEGKKKTYKNKFKSIKKMSIRIYISIVTLKINGLNAPTKRHRLVEWIQKQDPYICCLQETYFRRRDTYRLKVRGWKKLFHANGNQKKAGVAILISDKIDFLKNIYFIYLFFYILAALGRSCGTWDLHCGMRDLSLWRAGFSLVVERRLLSSCGMWAPECVGSVVCGTWLSS